MKQRWVLAWVALSVVGGVAQAAGAWTGIRYSTGDYAQKFEDISFAGGTEIKIERYYRVLSDFEGMFGRGWETDYDVRVEVHPDGSVVIRDPCGCKNDAHFVAPMGTRADVALAVEQIVAASTKIDPSRDRSETDRYRQQLLENRQKRRDEWLRLASAGLEPRRLLPGTRLDSKTNGYEQIVKLPEGFVRYKHGMTQYFDGRNRVVRMVDSNGNETIIARDVGGRIVKIGDSLGRWIRLQYDERGHAVRAESSGKARVDYAYDGRGLLVEARRADGSADRYAWSMENGLPRLATYSTAGGKRGFLGYAPPGQGRGVCLVGGSGSNVTRIDYEVDSSSAADERSRKVRVTESESEGKRNLSEARFEYEYRLSAWGERYVALEKSFEDGQVTTKSNDELERPLDIEREGEHTRFAYDEMGNTVKKITPTEETTVEYGDVGKVTKVVKRGTKDAPDAPPRQSGEYEYDDSGNLVRGRGLERMVELAYDGRGRVREIVSTSQSGSSARSKAGSADDERTRLVFEYNADNRPVIIESPGVGRIRVQYSSSGNISKVDSEPEGARIAHLVTSTFQGLLDIIRPATVSLGF
jgi:YD repeat-containing protein